MDLFSELENNKKNRQESNRAEKDEIISVSEYLDTVNRTLKSAKSRIVGEVTGVKLYEGRSYLYFSLKDKSDQSTINCFMWKRDYMPAGVELADGLEIIVSAYPAIYKPNGSISLQVDTIELVGEGALQIAYEKLKAKLSAEGLFDESRKRAIPDFPKRIGVITSRSGAVIHDFNTNLGKCGFEILFVDSKVEGALAIKDLLSAVKTLAKKQVDVLVMMRGGGSLESFQAFNNETLIRAVATFPAPVVTGIGHDKDAPLVSLVSDKNVSTPTAVANLLSAGFRDATLKLKISEQNLFSSFENAFREKMFYLQNSERIMETKIRDIFDTFRSYFETFKRIGETFQHAILEKKLQIENIAKILEARNPERQLKLGWSIARSKTGKIIRSVKDVATGENFQVSVADGTMDATRK